MERITVMIIFIACTVPWIQFPLSQTYTSIAAGPVDNIAYLTRTNKLSDGFSSKQSRPLDILRLAPSPCQNVKAGLLIQSHVLDQEKP